MSRTGLLLLVGTFILWGSRAYAAEIRSGETKVNENISGPPYFHLWTFEGVQNDGVIINAVKTAGSLDTAIDLFDPDGNLEAQGWQTGYGGDNLEHQLKKTGSYALKIKDYGLDHTGTYNLTFLKLPNPGDPNAGAISSGQTLVSRKIDQASDLEAFQFNGKIGEGVIINAVTTSGALDTAIDLFAPDGRLETRGWQTGYGGDVLEYQLKQTGLYTIVIKDYSLDHTGTYNLTFLKLPDPGDPNGGAIASGQTLVNRKIEQASDLEGFQFYGKVGEGVIINAVTISGALDTAIDLFAPDGRLETRGWQTGYGGDVLEYQLKQTGLYTIVIKDYGVNDTGVYDLTFLKLPGAISHTTDQDGSTIAPGQTINPAGMINVASDIDAFQFYGDLNDHVIINAVTIAGGLDTAIDLFAPDGRLETRGWQTGYGGDTLDYSLKQKGLYTIVIKDYGLNKTGSFWISLTKLPSALRPGLYDPYPSVGSTLSNLNNVFTWATVHGATGYDFYFGEDRTEPLRKIGSDLPSASMAFPTVELGKLYYWQVIARTSTGDIQGPFWWFQTGCTVAPGAASLTAPKGTLSNTSPTYSWKEVPCTTYYYLWVDGPSGNVLQKWYTPVQASCTGGSCSVTPITTLIPGSYNWWIQTWNSAGYGPWSSAMSFAVSTGGPPAKAILISPSGTITSTAPTYSWNLVPSATWYYLWVNDSEGSGKIRTWYTAAQAGCASGSGTCAVTPATPLASGPGQWWIQTWNDAGFGPWSDGMPFTVSSAGPPGKAILISPSGTITAAAPSYNWQAVANATWYQLWVSDVGGTARIRSWYTAAQAGCPSGTGICSTTPITALANGSYQWWVQTWNDQGYGPWSEPLQFAISANNIAGK